MKTINIILTDRQADSLLCLADEAKMTVVDYVDMLIDGHIIQYQQHDCPECGHRYRGTACNCKAGEII